MTFLHDWLKTLYDPRHNVVDFDTGSSDLFLPSTRCGVNCSSHTLYDPSASKTAHDLSKTFSLSYGDGSTAGGEQFTDDVKIAGLTV
jgi:cathepsin D